MNRIYWLTGLPCSGKTTIANELKRLYGFEGLDGDDIRSFMDNKDFTLQGRAKHMRSVAEIASRFNKYNDVVVSLISPLKEVREYIKNKYNNVREIYIRCDLEVCKRRDVKGMYARAMRGEIKGFTGIDDPYEEPEDPDLIIDTFLLSIEESIKIFDHWRINDR